MCLKLATHALSNTFYIQTKHSIVIYLSTTDQYIGSWTNLSSVMWSKVTIATKTFTGILSLLGHLFGLNHARLSEFMEKKKTEIPTKWWTYLDKNNDRTGMNMGVSLSVQQETSRQIISSSLSQLPPRLSLLLLLFYFLFCFVFWGVRLPRFPLWKLGLVFSTAFYLMTLQHTTSRPDREREGASHWQLDGCHKWQAFVLIKYTEAQALQRRKAEARRNNLFQLVELTMALSELVTFPCLFCLGGFQLLFEHIPPPP